MQTINTHDINPIFPQRNFYYNEFSAYLALYESDLLNDLDQIMLIHGDIELPQGFSFLEELDSSAQDFYYFIKLPLEYRFMDFFGVVTFSRLIYGEWTYLLDFYLARKESWVVGANMWMCTPEHFKKLVERMYEDDVFELCYGFCEGRYSIAHFLERSLYYYMLQISERVKYLGNAVVHLYNRDGQHPLFDVSQFPMLLQKVGKVPKGVGELPGKDG